MTPEQKIEQLESELIIILHNIRKVKRRINIKDGVYSCREVGELKHRLIACKSTMTDVCKLSTDNYLNNKP